MITIEPQHGLANRMRVIDSAAALALDLGMPLRVIWIRDRAIGCRYSDLFETNPSIESVIEVDGLTRLGGATLRIKRMTRLSRMPDFDRRTIEEFRTAGFDFTTLRDMPGFHIATADAFYHSRHSFMPFEPVQSLRESVERIASGFGSTIGVHVRRTDNRRSIAESPMDLFVARMQSAIDSDAATNFFLATDDPDVEAAMLDRFPGRIRSHPKRSYDRSRRVAIEDAMIDLYCLARTNLLLASFWSSFSQISSKINNIPFEVVRPGSSARFWW